MRVASRSFFVVLFSIVGTVVLTTTMTCAFQLAAMTALVMGGTGNPQPFPAYVADVDSRYIQQFYSGYTSTGLTTPEEFWPVTPPFPAGLTAMTFDESVDAGVGILDGAIKDNIDSPDDKVIGFGYSQSAQDRLDREDKSGNRSGRPGSGSIVLHGDRQSQPAQWWVFGSWSRLAEDSHSRCHLRRSDPDRYWVRNPRLHPSVRRLVGHPHQSAEPPVRHQFGHGHLLPAQRLLQPGCRDAHTSGRVWRHQVLLDSDRHSSAADAVTAPAVFRPVWPPRWMRHCASR